MTLRTVQYGGVSYNSARVHMCILITMAGKASFPVKHYTSSMEEYR